MFTLPEAALFDMDGTITRPLLDFPRIKAEMGIGDRPILEALAEMPPAQRLEAEAILHRYEDEAAAASTLNSGCREVLEFLAARHIATALVTRNRSSSVRTALRRHSLSFDVLITREDGKFKPDPEPLLLACHKLKVAPARTWMIGDGQYDVEAGLAAATRTIWVSHGRPRPFAAEPWQTVRNLDELTRLLRCCQNQ